MNSWIRRVKRLYYELTATKKVVLLVLLVFTLWILGILDKAREEDFNNFNWPRRESRKLLSSRFTEIPECRLTSNQLNLMIIIKSSAKNQEMRDSIRRTWGSYRNENGVEVMPVFILGQAKHSELTRRINKESEENRDILAISAIDSYRNNTFKLVAALNYASSPKNCISPDFIFLVDDDYMVHVSNLVRFAKTKTKSELVYEGFVFDTSPFRLKLHKHSISLEEYPYSRYPPYVSAGAVFLSSSTVQLFQTTVQTLRTFPFDDVFTGILAKSVGVPTTHNENFVFWNRHITMEEWSQGVIAVHGFARKNLEYEYDKLFG